MGCQDDDGLHRSPITEAIAKRVADSGPMDPSCILQALAGLCSKVGPPNPTVQVMGPMLRSGEQARPARDSARVISTCGRLQQAENESWDAAVDNHPINVAQRGCEKLKYTLAGRVLVYVPGLGGGRWPRRSATRERGEPFASHHQIKRRRKRRQKTTTKNKLLSLTWVRYLGKRKQVLWVSTTYYVCNLQ